jgi:hypothetical protein
MTTTTKPTVRYRGTAIRMGDFAFLHPIDHANHVAGQRVSNTTTVCTSRVLSWDEQTGRIETEYTVYVPEAAL